MAKGKDKNYVSFWSWMWVMFVVALPCIGVIMVIYWAIVGENETRKNYFRAIIAWFVIFSIITALLATLGFWAVIQPQVLEWIQHITH